MVETFSPLLDAIKIKLSLKDLRHRFLNLARRGESVADTEPEIEQPAVTELPTIRETLSERIALKLAENELRQLDQALQDPETLDFIKNYRGYTNYDRRALEYYAGAKKGILLSALNPHHIKESRLAAGPLNSLQFSKVGDCIGLIFQFSDENTELAAHILAAAPNLEAEELKKHADQILKQLDDLTDSSVPSHIIMVSSSLGRYKQHQVFMHELETRFPDVKIQKLRQPHR